MFMKKEFKPVRSLAWLALALLTAIPASRGQTVATLSPLHAFAGADGGVNSQASLIQGSDGNFYGTAVGTGTASAPVAGTVFEITPAGALTILHSFTDFAAGDYAQAGLIQGSDGNFYGTTVGGGANNAGTVFMLTPAGVFSTLYSFTAGSDGSYPGGLIQGSNGNFYGTTGGGGSSGGGTVFEITPAGKLTTLYSFAALSSRNLRQSSLIQGTDGNFYGTTGDSGSDSGGVVFTLTPKGVFTTLYTFGNGSNPRHSLVQGTDGNFYGTTPSGGTAGNGSIFEITPAGELTTLYSFTGGSDGGNPQSSLIQGTDGNFYGTTDSGGTAGSGAVFRITPAGVFTALYSFTGGSDGGNPQAGVIQGTDGNFYGTTSAGGASDYGTVFELTAHPAFFVGEIALGSGVYYLTFPNNGNLFGYYSFLTDPDYIYHFDLGYEYVFDADDGNNGVYFYDFASSTFFYTSPVFPFPYLYDFTLNTVLYYYPDPNNPGHYNTNGVRYFYRFDTGQVISK